MFHLAAYSESLGQVTNSDVNAVTDGVLTVRNSHLIFTEPWQLIAAYGIGDSLSRLRFNNPQLTVRGIPHLWPLEVSATIPDDPAVIDYRDNPLELPTNEEIILEATTTAVGPAVHEALLFLSPPDWNMNLPQGEGPFLVRGTAVVAAGSESAWTAAVDITLERDLYNGVYAVVGAYVVAANAIAFRLAFSTPPLYNNKPMRPGGLVQDTASLAPWKAQSMGLGEWGRFHTFEQIQLQTLNDTAGGTYEVRLMVKYLGQSPSLLRM